jgi:hypothetical protein
MAIEPIYGASMRTDPLLQRRNQAADPGDAPANAGAPFANPPAATAQRFPPRVLQMMQQGRETSALLSTLPGPNLSFFQPPAPPQGFGGPVQAGPAQAAGGPGGLAGARPRLNVPLLEMEAQGGVTSALLSPLMGTNQRAFQAPTPPVFAAPNAGAAAGTGPGLQAAGAQATGFQATGVQAAGMQAVPPQGAGAAIPRTGAQLLETEQAGRTTSRLLSGLMGSPQQAGAFGVSSFAGPTAGYAAGNSLAAMRTAEEVIQAVGTSSPSSANMRIASEAYQMEARAQQQYTQGVAGQGNWEWFA